jgi:hypothetical protein
MSSINNKTRQQDRDRVWERAELPVEARVSGRVWRRVRAWAWRRVRAWVWRRVRWRVSRLIMAAIDNRSDPL